MVKRIQTIVELEDDLDGGRADRTVQFGYDGSDYEIDLSNANAAAFEEAIAMYVGHARRTTATGKAFVRTTSVDPAAVRAWAAANGHEVSARGRVSQTVVDAYLAAGN